MRTLVTPGARRRARSKCASAAPYRSRSASAMSSRRHPAVVLARERLRSRRVVSLRCCRRREQTVSISVSSTSRACATISGRVVRPSPWRRATRCRTRSRARPGPPAPARAQLPDASVLRVSGVRPIPASTSIRRCDDRAQDAFAAVPADVDAVVLGRPRSGGRDGSRGTGTEPAGARPGARSAGAPEARSPSAVARGSGGDRRALGREQHRAADPPAACFAGSGWWCRLGASCDWTAFAA